MIFDHFSLFFFVINDPSSHPSSLLCYLSIYTCIFSMIDDDNSCIRVDGTLGECDLSAFFLWITLPCSSSSFATPSNHHPISSTTSARTTNSCSFLVAPFVESWQNDPGLQGPSHNLGRSIARSLKRLQTLASTSLERTRAWGIRKGMDSPMSLSFAL